MKKSMEKIEGLTEMEAFAWSIRKKLLEKPPLDRATVLLLRGDLGSGKTTFVRALARVFGVTGRVTSPTFVIEKRYPIRKNGTPFEKLIHIDAYRLEGENADVLDLENDCTNAQNLVCIEWPENLHDTYLRPDLLLEFSFVDENTRSIEINFQ